MRSGLPPSYRHPLPAAPAGSHSLVPAARATGPEVSSPGADGDYGTGLRRGEQAMMDSGPQGDSRQPVYMLGRRAAPRLRLSLPAQLVAVERSHTCILLNLSRTGAQIAILDAIRVGEGAILRCAGINHFAIVTRAEFGLNALEFDEPLTDSIVLDVRRYHENFAERERRALIETARSWVTGDSDEDRVA